MTFPQNEKDLQNRVSALETEVIRLRQEITNLKYIVGFKTYNDDYPILSLANVVVNDVGHRLRGGKSKIIVLPGREEKVGKAIKSDPEHVFVYALADPHRGLVRYIGRTQNPRLRFTRLKQDPRRCGNSSMSWIKNLQESGIEPVMIVLDLVPRNEGWEEERRWIQECYRHGYPLVNTCGVPSEWRTS